MLTVHHLGISQSDRVVWLCEELGIPYKLVRYDRDPETRMAPADYKALHPAGTAPVIEDDGVVLAETGAIVDYIVVKHGDGRMRLQPDNPGFANFLYWYHAANGTLIPAIMGVIGQGPYVSVMQARVDRYLAAMEANLSDGRDWLAGDELTVADIMNVFPLTTMRLFVPLDLSGFPNIRAYLKRISGRDAYRRAMAKADPDLAIPFD